MARRQPKCSCAEIAGEDPNCDFHGRTTRWAKENPDICQLADDMADLRTKIEALEKALEPFAALASIVDSFRHEDDSTCMHRLRAGDLRRARTALSDRREERGDTTP